MLPDQVLSTIPVQSPFVGGSALPIRETVDYETGGVALQDPSQGLVVQIWRARILNDKTEIVVDAETVPETPLITGVNITEVSLSFDQNMRPVVAYVEDGTPKLYWFDTVAGMQVITDYPGITTPRVTMDDKRALQSQVNDVIFAYIRDGALYYRQQRDRYLIEIDPTEDMPEPERTETRALVSTSPGLIKIGMNRQLRIQFQLRFPA